MSVLNVENISFGFGDKTILRSISFRLLKGEHVGLIGANGAGKTTFFNILTGGLIADEGSVSKPADIKIGYLDQHAELDYGMSIRDALRQAFRQLYQLERELLAVGDRLSQAGAGAEAAETDKLLRELGRLQDALQSSDFYSIDSLIANVAGGLGLAALGLDTPAGELSGGQRTKVKLAQLLLGSPDLLLLDEPTNYLDKEHVDWLSDYLCGYPNCFIVVSHDVGLLNKITNVIYHLEYSCLKRYPGNYEKFLKLRDEEHKRYVLEYTNQQKQIAKLEDFVNKNIVRASTTKRAQSRRKQLEKIERLEKPKNLPKPVFIFQPARESSKLLFKSHCLDIGYTYPILTDLDLKLEKGQKIAITGCNGIGKTTFLKTIMGILPAMSGMIEYGEFLHPAYFEQETKVRDITPIDEVWGAFPNKSQKEIRDALAKCGLKQEHVVQPMSALSGGEQSKVRLCKLMLTPSNWLLLDEPTNHLDVAAKQVLKDALTSYPGTILLVCHEKDFYEDWITDEWNMEDIASRKAINLSRSI